MKEKDSLRILRVMTAIYFFVLETTMTEKELHLHHFYVDGAEFVVHTVILSD